MSIPQQLQRLDSILRELAEIDFGYPLGENTIAPPLSGAAVALSEAGLSRVGGLSDLYSACDGISMPDVHSGYFIKPLRKVLKYDISSEPRAVLLESESPVLPLGSTGGGSLFVVEQDGGRVLLLPPGPLHEGLYDGRHTNARVVAEDIPHFLGKVIDDAAAFVRDERGHRYLTDE
ncbi:MAG TPA: hypothetical protein VH092_38595 [Urbifossiella sp.]|jgi:hypothetical protein|nr:hypothetical protein [Urbifossiella sp.]